MKVLENVDRIRPPTPAAFWRDYVARRRPVIIGGLLDGQPIERLRSAVAASRTLGAMEFLVQWNYTAT